MRAGRGGIGAIPTSARNLSLWRAGIWSSWNTCISASQANSSVNVMPGSEKLWSVQSGAYSGISARPSSTSSSQRRSSSVGSGRDTPQPSTSLRRISPATGMRPAPTREALALGHAAAQELELAAVVDALDPLDHRRDVGEEDVLAGAPAQPCRAAAKRVQERRERVVRRALDRSGSRATDQDERRGDVDGLVVGPGHDDLRRRRDVGGSPFLDVPTHLLAQAERREGPRLGAARDDHERDPARRRAPGGVACGQRSGDRDRRRGLTRHRLEVVRHDRAAAAADAAGPAASDCLRRLGVGAALRGRDVRDALDAADRAERLVDRAGADVARAPSSGPVAASRHERADGRHAPALPSPSRSRPRARSSA